MRSKQATAIESLECGVNFYSTAFTLLVFVIYSFMLYFISNISNANICLLFYFTLYNRLQSSLSKLPTDGKGGPTNLIFGFW